jgi:hypothetical protein
MFKSGKQKVKSSRAPPSRFRLVQCLLGTQSAAVPWPNQRPLLLWSRPDDPAAIQTRPPNGVLLVACPSDRGGVDVLRMPNTRGLGPLLPVSGVYPSASLFWPWCSIHSTYVCTQYYLQCATTWLGVDVSCRRIVERACGTPSQDLLRVRLFWSCVLRPPRSFLSPAEYLGR